MKCMYGWMHACIVLWRVDKYVCSVNDARLPTVLACTERKYIHMLVRVCVPVCVSEVCECVCVCV